MRRRRTTDELEQQAATSLAAALPFAGIAPHWTADSKGRDLVAAVDDRILVLELEAVSSCTGARAAQLVREGARALEGQLPVVVADKITAEGRHVLTEAEWSWLDRRGRLHLRGPGVRVDIDVPGEEDDHVIGRRAAIAGRSGLAVAYWLCSHPSDKVSPTRQALELGLAPSTISTMASRLRDAGLVHAAGTGIFPELFWELADVWDSPRTWLAEPPKPTDHAEVDPPSACWRRTGADVAAALGAPVVSAGGGAIDLYVAGPVEITIAARRHGVAPPGAGAASLRVAPARAVVTGPFDAEVTEVGGWTPASALAVALDLAQDRARGREILAEWRRPDAVWL